MSTEADKNQCNKLRVWDQVGHMSHHGPYPYEDAKGTSPYTYDLSPYAYGIPETPEAKNLLYLAPEHRFLRVRRFFTVKTHFDGWKTQIL